jgi:AcrR family transcriptional regulator
MSRPRDEQKIHHIHQAALRIILEQGFSGLRMSDVAKAAGVATGTVYIYFQNKHELINSLYLHLKRSKAQQMFADYDAAMPFMAGFRKLWFAYLQTTLDKPEESAFLEQYYRSPFIEQAHRDEADRLLGPIFDLLERGKRELLVRNAPTHLLAAHLSGSIAELARMAQANPLTLTAEDKETAFKMAWDSIRA